MHYNHPPHIFSLMAKSFFWNQPPPDVLGKAPWNCMFLGWRWALRIPETTAAVSTFPHHFLSTRTHLPSCTPVCWAQILFRSSKLWGKWSGHFTVITLQCVVHSVHWKFKKWWGVQPRRKWTPLPADVPQKIEKENLSIWINPRHCSTITRWASWLSGGWIQAPAVVVWHSSLPPHAGSVAAHTLAQCLHLYLHALAATCSRGKFTSVILIE